MSRGTHITSDKSLNQITAVLASHFLLTEVREKIGDGHLIETPRRWASVIAHYSQPYNPVQDLGKSFTKPVTDDVYDSSFVLQKNIPYRGLCAHHLLPVLGYAHVAYIPRRTIVGLSKLARVVYGFSHAMGNTQEQVGEWIADAIAEHLDPLGVAIIIDAEHTCMSARGVEEHRVTTTTAALRGVFAKDSSARAELYSNIAR